jgi:acyl-[acyl carrier protein]--UDP-N-acetylglucosamine O-acyltransferase
MAAIDPTARIEPGAVIGQDVSIGPYCVVGPQVKIDDGCRLLAIAVRPYLVFRHLPICEDSQEGIDGVVGQCPAIVREGRRPRGVIRFKVTTKMALP